MKYIKIGIFGAKDFENAVKICVHSSRARARANNCKNMCKIHVVYRFICFWGQEFQKCNQNFHTLAQGPCTCKNVCKIHVVYRFICFWIQEFQNCNQKFCIINQLIKNLSFIESIQYFIINSFFDSLAILFKHSFLIIAYT